MAVSERRFFVAFCDDSFDFDDEDEVEGREVRFSSDFLAFLSSTGFEELLEDADEAFFS